MVSKKNFYDSWEPKVAFYVGLISGFATVFTVGFFVMLYVFFNGGIEFNSSSSSNSNKNSGTNTDTVVAADEDVAGELNMAEVTSSDWLLGDDNASITIVEYSDIDCPYCQQHHDTIKSVVDSYEGDVNWVYRHFPLLSLHPNAATKAEAAECAGELAGNEGFWDYLDSLMGDNSGLAVSKLADVAVDVLGVDKDEFQSCLDSGKYADKVSEQADDAAAAGGQGTPYNVVIGPDGTLYPASGALPADSFNNLIDSLLES